MSGASRSPGEEFAEALATKDFARAAEVLDPQVDFRALTPNFSWQASGPDDVVTSVLREWFEDSDEVEELLSYEAEPFADREHISYRIRGRDEDGPYVLEQQAYLAAEAGRIVWMRVLCSGKRPVDQAARAERDALPPRRAETAPAPLGFGERVRLHWHERSERHDQ